MKKMNVMKSAVSIILLLLIIYSLNYIYNLFANIEQFEGDDLDLKLGKSLEIAFEKMSFINKKSKSQ
uniref:Uncharacterized protein n=1 Tax=viral metagenome TaxID=1070528 RepID=A0A6C0L257_9ZZZZ|tara:strand:+ start:4996 stop:5196 length:201 start_codon:yes stop_codon:yes gene_type:complete